MEEWIKREVMPAVDKWGHPTTYATYSILKHFLENTRKYSTLVWMEKIMPPFKKDIPMICEQLLELDFVERHPREEGSFRYNIHCENDEQQTGFEKYLLDVKNDWQVPAHKRLPYSPSFPIVSK